MSKSIFVFIFMLCLYFEHPVTAQSFAMYLFEKSGGIQNFVPGQWSNYNWNSNEYYEAGLRFNNKAAECNVYIKNNDVDIIHWNIQREYHSRASYSDSVFSYQLSSELIKVTNESEEKLKRSFTNPLYVVLVKPAPDLFANVFSDALFRKVNLYRSETYTKTVSLWRQSAWQVLQNATKDELKNGFSLFVPFEFYVKLEDSDLLNASAKPSLKFDRQTIMNLRSLQKRVEAQTPGSTAPGVEVNDRPVGNPLFDASLGFDSKTGMLTLSLSNEADGEDGSGAVRANLDTLFGYKGDDQNFLCGFTVNTPDGETIAVKCDDKICEQGDFRIFDLVDRETISKESKIWELAIWEQLLERATAKRAEKFTISFVVKHELISQVKDAKPDVTTLGTKKDDKTVFDTKKDEKTVSVTIDSRTILRMEQLRKTQETEKNND